MERTSGPRVYAPDDEGELLGFVFQILFYFVSIWTYFIITIFFRFLFYLFIYFTKRKSTWRDSYISDSET